jgi:hypothetical protein
MPYGCPGNAVAKAPEGLTHRSLLQVLLPWRVEAEAGFQSKSKRESATRPALVIVFLVATERFMAFEQSAGQASNVSATQFILEVEQ